MLEDHSSVSVGRRGVKTLEPRLHLDHFKGVMGRRNIGRRRRGLLFQEQPARVKKSFGCFSRELMWWPLVSKPLALALALIQSNPLESWRQRHLYVHQRLFASVIVVMRLAVRLTPNHHHHQTTTTPAFSLECRVCVLLYISPHPRGAKCAQTLICTHTERGFHSKQSSKVPSLIHVPPFNCTWAAW